MRQLVVCESSGESQYLIPYGPTVDGIMQSATWFRSVLSVSIAVLIASQASAADVEMQFRVAPGERQLFVDHVGISKIENLEPTMHQPAKHGAVIVPDQPWETTLQTRCTPVWDDERGVYRIWMITSTNIPGLAGTSYAESEDGLHWNNSIPGANTNQWFFGQQFHLRGLRRYMA
jgi:hypothetical protein